MIPEIRISDYDYPLPDARIAKYPLAERDASKLLRYNGGVIDEHIFKEIPSLLPEDSLMVFNDTKVVPARLHFMKETGAHIEIFCLEPSVPAEYSQIFAERQRCRWKCIVGNVKRWKSDILELYNPEKNPEVSALDLKASLVERDGETSVVEFSWSGGQPFSRVLEICGSVPIPPYLNRDSEAIDTERYQTLYARYRGSVAAPTAGLHFTQTELDAIRAKGTDMETVCLHVGAGTFLPVKSELVSGHRMHREPFVVRKSFIEDIAGSDRKVVAVGTKADVIGHRPVGLPRRQRLPRHFAGGLRRQRQIVLPRKFRRTAFNFRFFRLAEGQIIVHREGTAQAVKSRAEIGRCPGDTDPDAPTHFPPPAHCST